MKRIAVLVACLATAATITTSPAHAGPSTSHGHDVSLRVATYNIHAGAGSDEVFDLDRTAAELAELDADVVAMQEVDVHWSDRSQWRDLAGELADRLGMEAYFGPIYSLEPLEPGQPRREYGNALLSRFPIRYGHNHEITRLSTQDPDPVPKPVPGFPEIAIKVRGVPVHVYATHLDYRADPSVRRTQVGEMLDIMGDSRHGATVLMGDFNAKPDAPELAPLWNQYRDAWSEAGEGAGATYPADDPVDRIDDIAVSSRVTVTAARVGESLASDHRPVVAELRIRR
jgi:endonuclease/exonuclease/phosphatase family metal-dependent hydrolase